MPEKPLTPAPPRFTNRLSGEKSPYLLQHAHNPVDWYPWDEDAFAKARAEDKMVLVSIGYATCHWCHVMERETFEDERLASYLNAHFVAIKVDREERPDVDRVFMEALQAMGKQGGWPLNMFATPDGRPVTGGTYFPPTSRHGLPSFGEVLEAVSDAWRNRRQDILQNATVLTDHLRKQAIVSGNLELTWDPAPIAAAVAQYRRAFDETHGGFAFHPQNKFPPSMGLMLLLRHHVRTGDADARIMVEQTLRRMVAGGIYDQMGGGLSRYSTDPRWLVPHFEKMLYDNALFAQALTETYQTTGTPFYRDFARDVLEYVLRDMTSPEGAFYSAEDADSEGEEGRFYVWTPEEVRTVLPPEEARCALAYWDISPQGNFEHGRSIPHTLRSLDEVAQALSLTDKDLSQHLLSARRKLFDARTERVRPLRDDKVLTSWNALTISALAKAGTAFSEPRYIQAAERAALFVRERLKDAEGRLLRRYRDGEARIKGYLVDYAQMAVACLDLYEATFDVLWFKEAWGLVDEINRLFRNDTGPYFDTGIDAEMLISRTMEGYDGVEPSGNSGAAQALLRLHAYGVRKGFDEDAQRVLSGYTRHLGQAGAGFPALLCALDFLLAQPLEVVIVGNPTQADTQELLKVVRREYRPAKVVALASPEQVEDHGRIIPILENRRPVEGRATAYLCRNSTCGLPACTPEELAQQLGGLP